MSTRVRRLRCNRWFGRVARVVLPPTESFIAG